MDSRGKSRGWFFILPLGLIVWLTAPTFSGWSGSPLSVTSQRAVRAGGAGEKVHASDVSELEAVRRLVAGKMLW